MGLAAGKLDRRLTLLRASQGDDGLQTVEGDFEPVGTVWAQRTDISDGERSRASGVTATATTRFQVRYSASTARLTVTNRVREGGQEFDIVGIKELGRRVGFEITAARRADS
jgi:SPP1 family predicted phage head-tail adaptor